MALLGTLKGFGVTDIFQLISQQIKTGTLVLTSPKYKISILFQEGIIKGVTNDNWATDPRAKVLLNSGLIGEKEYKAALDIQKKGSSKWEDILISQGKLEKTLLDKAANIIIKEIFLDIFQWKEGSYRFEDGDPDTEAMLSCHIVTENLILDTLRIIDEWPLIKQKIPPVDYCPVVITPITEEIAKKNSITAEDAHIFDLIDGKKTIETIIRESLETSFDGLSAFVKLIDASLIEVFPKETKEQIDASITRQAFWKRIKNASVYILLAICIAGLITIGHPRVGPNMFFNPVIKEYIKTQKDLATLYTTQRIRPSNSNANNHAH
ncbi:MAG: DUF4388 domain-containing protein [Deltaproteobacteria bacterium]|nr:DUF4388 domain-containing protein [Deltaproteobacteria bacterium]